MAIKRYVGATAREAMSLVRRELGTDAIILSNKRLPGGYTEILAAGADAMEELVEHANPAAARQARAQSKRAAERDAATNLDPLEERRTEMLRSDGTRMRIGNGTPVKVQSFQDYLQRGGQLPAASAPGTTRAQRPLRAVAPAPQKAGGLSMYQDVAAAPVSDEQADATDLQWSPDEWARTESRFAEPWLSKRPQEPTARRPQIDQEAQGWANTRIDTAAAVPTGGEPAVFRRRPARVEPVPAAPATMNSALRAAARGETPRPPLQPVPLQAVPIQNPAVQSMREPERASAPLAAAQMAQPVHAVPPAPQAPMHAVHAAAQVAPQIAPQTAAQAAPQTAPQVLAQAAAQAAVQPLSQPLIQPATQPVMQPAMQPAMQPVMQPAMQAATAPAMSPVAQIVQPASQSGQAMPQAMAHVAAAVPVAPQVAPPAVAPLPVQAQAQTPQTLPVQQAQQAQTPPTADPRQLQINTVLRMSAPVFSIGAAPIAMPVVVPTVVTTPPRAAAKPVQQAAAAAAAASAAPAQIPTLGPAIDHVPARPVHDPDPKLLAELQTMRSLLQDQLASLSNSMAAVDAVRRHPIAVRVMTRLLTGGFSADVARRIADHAPQEGDAAAIDAWLQDVLATNIHCDDAYSSVIEQAGAARAGAGQILALVGPTGVGKTTTVAKLAARFAVKYGTTHLGLITLDAYRVAAPEQLRTYGRILGTPVHLAQDGATLRELLASMSNKKLVLIDTCGLSQRDERLNEMLDLIDGASNAHRRVQRVLLLNAASHAETLDETARAWRAAEASGAVLTKLDEASRIGGALDCILRYRLRLLGLTNGQRVPEDWHLANAKLLAHFALKPAASLFALGEDEGALLAQVARVKAQRLSSGSDTANGGLHA